MTEIRTAARDARALSKGASLRPSCKFCVFEIYRKAVRKSYAKGRAHQDFQESGLMDRKEVESAMDNRASRGSLAVADGAWRARLAVTIQLLAVAFGAQITYAEPIRLPADKQEPFRQAFYQAYSDRMAAGGYYDALKEEENKTPKLRILDCLHDRCLIDMVLDPGFDSDTYLVRLDGEGTFYGMEPVDTYGRAVEQAAFMTSGSDMQVYITSVTHMGTQAAQLFAYDGSKIGSQIALRTSVEKKVEDAEGDLNALDRAAAYAKTLTKPSEF